jgi:broad specificity phosphatase PhoE
MKLYFVRHGESVANLTAEFSCRGFKHPLTPKGLAQAHTLAQNLSARKISRIYSSPLQRAVQTAGILSETLQVEVEVTGALREWDVGIYEGTTDPQGWQLHRQVQEDWYFNHKLDSKMPEGESFIEIRQRFVPFIEGLLQDGQNSDEELVLVGHGGLFICMLPVIFQNIDHEFAVQHGFPNTGYALGETRPGGLCCVDWCGTPVPNQAS